MNSKCPHCGTEYEVEKSELGSHVECQVCGKEFVVRPLKPKTLHSDQERTILHLKPSMAPVVASWLVPCVPWLVLLGAAFNTVEQGFGTGLLVVGAIVLGLILLLIGLAYSRTEYIITNRRVMVKSGIITKSERQVHVQDMRDIFLRRGLFQRITGTGSISIGSQTTGLLARIVLGDIKEYSLVIETLESLKGL